MAAVGDDPAQRQHRGVGREHDELAARRDELEPAVEGPLELRLNLDPRRVEAAVLEPARIEVEPELERALDRGLELVPPGGELVVLPTYTAMLALRRIVASRGHVRNYWERAA